MRALVEHGPAAQESSKRERTEGMIWQLLNLRYRAKPQAETQRRSREFSTLLGKKKAVRIDRTAKHTEQFARTEKQL